MPAQNDLPPVLSGSIPRIHDSTLFEKCQDLSITHKNYNNLRIIFNTANPKLAHFNIREINEISLESDTQKILYNGVVIGTGNSVENMTKQGLVIIFNKAATKEGVEAVTRAVNVSFSDDAQEVTLSVKNAEGSKSANTLTIPASIFGSIPPADQNLVTFNNIPDLDNLALNFKTSSPKKGIFIPVFDHIVHCKITNKNTIIDIAHPGSWSSYVHSSDVIKDGRVSLRFGQTDRQVMFGFSDTFSSQEGFSVLNYAIFSNNGVISIRESGNIPKSLPSFGKHTIDDVFSVERIGNTVAYLKNDVTFYVSTVNSTEDVHFCSAFTDIGALVTDVLQHNYYPATEGSFTVKFDQSVGCKITKNEIINTAKAGGWGNSIAYSSGILKEGYVSLRFGQTDKQVMFGLAANLSSHTFSVLNYAIFSNNGVISIRESGNPPKSLPSFGKHTINDVFSVKRCGNTITYLKNGMVFYASTVITTKDMHFCVTFADLGASVTDMLQYTSYPADGLFGIKNVKGISLNKATREVSYNHTVVATINQDKIPKFDLGRGYTVTGINTLLFTFIGPKSGWGLAGLYSSSYMKHDGRISLSMGQTDSQVMFGFGNKDISQPYHCMFANNGVIVVIEGSKTTASLGKYTTEDVLSIERRNYTLIYRKNGVIINTSTEDLVGDLHPTIISPDHGAKVTNVQIRDFYTKTDTDGFYIMLNEKASQAAIDAVAEAVSCQIDDPDVTVEIFYSAKLLDALPGN
ncbi:hypothetical protein [bacterium endosymbiont of Bathymodiolus sp. 5 South]|uniref:hypothetical protein n=1 Tax=bacterium endosymbiont of Bathymodiolus sp. 5 South TaxID=1181670 RepID=UPI0010B4CEEC|nr:hypothetical protein [bacterium endosymbiont of Bathymodiolus sp. 5 South]SSC07965.1 Alkaline phosphatase [bacterium endosymbiont of Bathymodiolus sp. 5 South]VVH61396.1 Alkaline phosphatase (EC [uncultured Gammaproteobacteria bacterium]